MDTNYTTLTLRIIAYYGQLLTIVSFSLLLSLSNQVGEPFLAGKFISLLVELVAGGCKTVTSCGHHLTLVKSDWQA